ncbi:hypothetical protein C8R44DRAFT_879589 [Mycena epipterygia]|nr:hypothetical protein C8R44DRAFT_879589 [Mycena epipterygia]
MPRKKKATPIHKHYFKDLKNHVIYQAYTLGKTSTEIAIDLDMPLRVVQRVKRTWREIGEVCRDRRYLGRSPMMSQSQTKFMLVLVDHTPDIYLDEIQEQLYVQHDVDVSLATISWTMKRLGMSSKQLSRHAAEHCEHARHEFLMQIGDEPADHIVCADESAFVSP